MYLCLPTWLPKLICESEICKVKPESKYVAIRKSSKYDPDKLRLKMERMIDQWNCNNPFIAYEGLEFDFEEICENEKKMPK